MENPKVTILVVDDEDSIRRSLQAILTSKDYEVQLAESGKEALSLAAANPPDLVMLDLGLSDMNGLDVCQEMRTWFPGPILVLSAIVRETEKVAALDFGADDYITKPYSISELLARVRALLRRQVTDVSPPRSVTFGELAIDFTKRRVSLAGNEVKLAPKEYGILELLVRHADCVVTNQQVLEHVWKGEYQYDDDFQNLRVHVSNLRHKIEPNPQGQHFIKNEPRVGYRFISEPIEE